MSDEEAFQAALDAEPDNHFVREVFADWLDDMGDPRAAGYRALGQVGWYAKLCEMLDSQETYYVFGTQLHYHSLGDKWASARLPNDWFWELTGDSDDERSSVWKYFPSRREAEDAAAIAFSRLPPDRQAQLLTRPTAATGAAT